MSDSKNLSIDELAEEAENSTKPESTVTTVPLSAEESEAILREVSGDGKYTLVQQYLIDICGENKAKEAAGQRFPSSRELQELIKKRIELEHGDNIRVKSALLNSVPAQRTIRKYLRHEEWTQDIKKKMKEKGMFSPEKIGAVILAVEKNALTGDPAAAKMYLTMSGDYDEKGQSADEKFNVYKKYADAMSRKKPENK